MIIATYRGDGQRDGPPITEPLLSDAALIHRGRAELDANAHPLVRLQLGIVPRPGIRLGQLVEAADPAHERPCRGKVVGIQITVTPQEITHTLDIEVPQ